MRGLTPFMTPFMEDIGNIHRSLSAQDLTRLVEAIAAGGRLVRGGDERLSVIAADSLTQGSQYEASIATDLDAIVWQAESLGLNTTHQKQLNMIKELRNEILHSQPATDLDWSLTQIRYDNMPKVVLKMVFEKLELKELVACTRKRQMSPST